MNIREGAYYLQLIQYTGTDRRFFICFTVSFGRAGVGVAAAVFSHEVDSSDRRANFPLEKILGSCFRWGRKRSDMPAKGIMFPSVCEAYRA